MCSISDASFLKSRVWFTKFFSLTKLQAKTINNYKDSPIHFLLESMPPPKAITFIHSMSKAWTSRRPPPSVPASPHGEGKFVVLCLRCKVMAQSPPEKCGIEEVKGTEIKIRVAAPPVDEEANEACKILLGGALGVPKSDVLIAKGAHFKIKEFRVWGKSQKYWGGETGVKDFLTGQRRVKWEANVRKVPVDAKVRRVVPGATMEEVETAHALRLKKGKRKRSGVD